ncbi:MAG: hypothetical protein Q9222_005700 [Ikaeria aurantiellina]
MAVAGSPWKTANDSPSRQLLWELSRLAVTSQEELYEQLDRDSQEREAVHKSALAEAIAKHEKVRADAEAERDRLEKQIQHEKQRREAEIRQEEHRQRQATVERELAEKERVRERAKTAERAERAAIAERDAQIARQRAEAERRERDALNAKKEEQETQARRKLEEKERQLRSAEREAPAAELRRIQQTAPAIASSQQRPSEVDTQNLERDAEHQRYLAIHKNLKDLRQFMAQQAKQDSKLKSRMGDMRRDIRKSIGQLREGKGVNATPISSILKTLKEVITSYPQPTVRLANFITSSAGEAQVPALFVYLLNHFAKAVVSQFIREAAVSPKIADPIGTVAVSVFARDEFRFDGHSLIDVLIAKLHVVCPPLFGIYGSESTQEGRTRLGWWREGPGGPWISEQSHQDRMTGLGAGYAALSLRSFEQSKMSNPYPPYHYWRAMASILNVPAGQVTETHMVLLRALLANSEGRFLDNFGEPAKRLMGYAVTEYPKRATKGSVAAVLLSNLGNTVKKDKKLYL